MDNLLALMLFPLGRGAGGAFGKWSKLCSPLIGVIFGLLLGVHDWWLAGFALAGWLSEKPDPASDALGRITDGVGERKDYIKLAIRGAVGAIPYLPLYFVTNVLPLLAFTVAWPVAAYIGTKLSKYSKYSAWEWSEILRYFLAWLFIYGVRV